MKRRAKIRTLVAILVVHAVLFTALAQIKTEMGTQPISLVGGRCTGVTMLMVSTYTGHAGYCPCPSAALSGVAAMTWQLAVIIAPMVTMRKLLTKCAHSRQYAYGFDTGCRGLAKLVWESTLLDMATTAVALRAAVAGYCPGPCAARVIMFFALLLPTMPAGFVPNVTGLLL